MANRKPKARIKIEPSAGMKRVRAEWAALIKDTSLSETDFLEGFFRSVREHATEMSQAEVAEFRKRAAALIYDFEKELASRGTPRPGNNPLQPN